MIKLIRANQRKFLAGLTILSMITFVVSYRAAPSDHAGSDRVYGTVNGKPIFISEISEARAEFSAMKDYVDFSNQKTDEQGRLLDPQAELMHELITAMGTHQDWYPLLRHEAIADGVQVSNDDIESVLANDTRLSPEDHASDEYFATRAGVTNLLKIIARYDQIADMLKISKPGLDHDLVAEDENIQLDLLQLKAADYLSKVPPPTTQQMQEQFTQFAAVVPHQPNPTTNPFGFGYRLPMRAKLQFVRLSPDAVNAAIAATKPPYDWGVLARKYYLSHVDEFPTTQPTTSTTTATSKPAGPMPFEAVQDRILTEIRQPLNTALMDQVQRLITSTLNTDWQTYSQFVASGKPEPEPLSSLGVPYTSYDYLTKLAEKVQSKFKVALAVTQTPDALSQEQIAALPVVGTSTIADGVITQATEYLNAVDKKDPNAPADLNRPSPAMSGSDDTSVVIFRLAQALPSEPPPSLQSVAAEVDKDLHSAAAFKLAETQAKDIVSNIKDRPLILAATSTTPIIHIDHLSEQSYDVPEIKPPLGDSQQSFTTQAFDLLSTYNPKQNRNPAEVISLPEQARVFPAQLSFVDAEWNSESFFSREVQTRMQVLHGEQNLLKGAWFQYEAVLKRTDFKPAKNNS